MRNDLAGMKVIDYCSNGEQAVAAVSRLFPTLQSDTRSCTANSSKLNLGECLENLPQVYPNDYLPFCLIETQLKVILLPDST
jgi:hypothetical protein